VKLPYQDFAVFLIQEWRKIGVEAENRPLETAAWFTDGQDTGNFELIVGADGRVHGRAGPVPRPLRDGQHAELGPLLRPRIDDLFSRRRGRLDPAERKKLSTRSRRSCWTTPTTCRALVVAEPRAVAKVKNYVAPPTLHEPEAAGRLAVGG
jgi:hypothetical protein